MLVASSSGAASAQTSPAVHRFDPTSDFDTLPFGTAASPGFGSRTAGTPDCGPPSATAVPDGQPIVVSLPPAPEFTVGKINPYLWRHPMVTGLEWRLSFEAFMYLPALAVRAANDGSTQSLATIVNQVVTFHQQNPDPRTSAYGWDEGTAQRRLQVEDCLYELTHDTHLVPGMAADVAVQLGPRFYGPPYRSVHNHGVMANLRIIRTGELLGRSNWVSIGLTRLRQEAPLAFSSAGTTWEQSSLYQQVNVNLWLAVADELAQHSAYATAARAVRSITAKALRALSWMTEPDGNLVQIGDADRVAGYTSLFRAGAFRDDQAGYAIGRWSATDPRTTYYTIRYGPPRRAHGHEDRGGLTWTTLGTRVLVGPGRYDSNGSAWDRWRTSPRAQNVAIPATGTFAPNAPAALTGVMIQAPARAYRVVDGLYGRKHTRNINVFGPAHRLVVRDAFAGGTASRQYWNLDPAWRLVSAPTNGTVLVFSTASGRKLTIRTT
ncbi:MAG: heparinase II/III family protein, partial [Frankiaceae bacterium]|nr:heparinase II/III family protein [Frankiaceae bacterium]